MKTKSKAKRLGEELHKRGFTVLMEDRPKTLQYEFTLLRDQFKWEYVLNINVVNNIKCWAERIEDRFENVKREMPINER